MPSLKKILLSVLALTLCSSAALLIKKNPLDLYQDRGDLANAIYRKMTLDEKIGQLIQPSYTLLAETVSRHGSVCNRIINNATSSDKQIISACGLDQIQQYHLGAVLTGGLPFYNPPTLENRVKLNALANLQHRLGDPLDPVLLIGNDAIHGVIADQGSVIFPHNIGLGVTHNPALIYQLSRVIGQDSLKNGFNWVFAPTVALAQDLRWGRTYESFGQQPTLVKTLAKAYIEGLQDIHNTMINGPLATAKHFIGDGATLYGIDEGDDVYSGNQASFWALNGAGYEGALQAHVATIMVSYSAIDDSHDSNNTRMHFGGKWDLLNQFKHQGIIGSDNKRYQFTGLVVSDWNGLNKATSLYNKTHAPLSNTQAVAKSINAGIDIIMLGIQPHHQPLKETFDAIKSAYQQGLISDDRLKEAVTRILQVKCAMHSVATKTYPALQAQERNLALQAAEQSLVLLKNAHGVLPLQHANIQHIVFIGDTDDLGLQNGGWTVTWQGQKGNKYFTGANQSRSGAQTLEQAIKTAAIKGTHFYHAQDHLPHSANAQNTVVISVVAEPPYAEFMGDIANDRIADSLYLSNANSTNTYMKLPQSHWLGLKYSQTEASSILHYRALNIPVITVVYSGRPVILAAGGTQAPLNNADALIAAFLPGTLGGKALSKAIFGDYRFRSFGQSNTLTFPWPENMAQVSDHFQHGALFPIGYGLGD